MATDLFAKEFAPRNREADEDAIADFLANGGEITKLRKTPKNFRKEPKEKGAFFLFTPEERLKE